MNYVTPQGRVRPSITLSTAHNTIDAKTGSAPLLNIVTINGANALSVEYEASTAPLAIVLTGAFVDSAGISLTAPAGGVGVPLTLSGATFTANSLELVGNFGASLTLQNGLASISTYEIAGLTTIISAGTNFPSACTCLTIGAPTLTTVTITATGFQGDAGALDFSGQALDASSVATLLSFCATYGAATVALDISGGTNAAPVGGAANADIITITLAGGSVAYNE